MNGVIVSNFPKKFSIYELSKFLGAISLFKEPEFEFFDEEGWPHYKVKEELPPLKAGEQSVLMKDAIVNYFLERELID